MQTVHYPKEQMHRIRYSRLTEKQIGDKLAAAASGPTCATAFSDALSGKSVTIVTDDGLTLGYHFKAKNRLSLVADGGGAVQAGYGALTLQRLILFSHMVPGTQKGYQVIVDPLQRLATVFEIWFSGYSDNREVQRQIHFGYIQGSEAPTTRHSLTNRLEGKGFHWVQDTGIETLELYPSALYSTFVELTRLGGELCFCGPSDYVKIDDDLYIYSRVECEFSGTMTLYVLDLNELRQAGVRLGFDATDALEYYMFTGTGEMVGQIALFEPFDDHGEKIVLGNRPSMSRKGERPVYRPLLTNPAMSARGGGSGRCQEHRCLWRAEPDGRKSASRKRCARWQGADRSLRRWRSGTAIQIRRGRHAALAHRARRLARGAIRSVGTCARSGVLWTSARGSPRHDGVAVVLDFQNALSCCVQGWLGTPYMANEAARKTWFGVIEMDGSIPPQYRRHTFTDELVGRAMTWNYSPGLTSMHVYTTPHSFSWIIFLPGGAGGLEWSGPAQYVKLREDLYLFNWLEEACNGTLGILVINTRTMHDCGIGYHCGKMGLSMSSIGAQARNAGAFNIRRFYV